MKNYSTLAFGILLMAVALWLAIGTTNQDSAASPEVARELATRLHESPTLSPTPTVTHTPTATPLPSLTPVATVTPLPGWSKLSTRNVELWLPPSYQLLENDAHTQIIMYFSRIDLSGVLKFEAIDATIGLNSFRTVRVFQVKTRLSPKQVPYGIDILSQIVQAPVPISIGRYTAYRAVDDRIRLARTHYTDLVYWIPHGEYYYVVIFSTWAEYDKLDVSIFEQSVRTLTILSDE